MPRPVPNTFPKYEHATHRLAIISDAPGQEEEILGQPLIGAGGRMLRHLLGVNKLAAEHVFLGNICQLRPPDDDISKFSFEGSEIQTGLQTLRQDLHRFNPNCTLLLGRAAFRAFCPELGRVDSSEDMAWSVSNYRGSIVPCGLETGLLPAGRTKCVVAYHPSYVLRSYGDSPYLKFDVARAVRQSAFPDLRGTAREILTRPTLAQVLEAIQTIRTFKRETGFDVEGWNDNVGVTIFSIATSPTSCLVVPIWIDGKHYWTEDEEVVMWTAVAGWLSDPDCKKRVTNATYEQFILAWKHNIIISGISEDTMFKHWEIFPELEKSLAVQASIWTEEPYYKHERESGNTEEKLVYNGKDSCVTFEASDAQENALKACLPSYHHYLFNIKLLPAIHYVTLRGCKFDLHRAQEHKAKAAADLGELQSKISSDLGRDFNVKSVNDKKWLLYEYFSYKPYVRYGETTKEEVLLRYYARDREPLLKLVIDAIGLRTRISDIDKLTTNEDGRIRSNYNLVGTDTGRLSSSASNAMVSYHTKTGILKWDQTGTNLQNVTKELRDCFIPDSSNHFFFQCDLSGADGWTVAADLAALGSSTMLDDYLAGIKPAKVLLLMLAEHEAGRDPAVINRLQRTELAALTKALKFPDTRDDQGRPGDWKYLCMKRVQHGSNYGMEPDKLSATIFKDSDGLIDLTTKQAGIYQYLYKLRYNPTLRTDWITRELSSKGYLDSASGIRRRFFGLRGGPADPNVVRAALAFEPQANTTFVTNLALRNLWYDPSNRTSKHQLFVEPLLQIHDALAGQFKCSYAAWAVERLKGWFKNPVKIHGIEVDIPFEGGYGPNWFNTKEVEF